MSTNYHLIWKCPNCGGTTDLVYTESNQCVSVDAPHSRTTVYPSADRIVCGCGHIDEFDFFREVCKVHYVSGLSEFYDNMLDIEKDIARCDELCELIDELIDIVEGSEEGFQKWKQECE